MTSNDGPSFSLHVTYYVAPENAQKFLDALKPAYDGVLSEPLNTFFEVYQSTDEPGVHVFKFVENWNCSLDHFMNVQLKKDYYAPYLEATEPLHIRPREYKIWQRLPENMWISIRKDFYASSLR